MSCPCGNERRRQEAKGKFISIKTPWNKNDLQQRKAKLCHHFELLETNVPSSLMFCNAWPAFHTHKVSEADVTCAVKEKRQEKGTYLEKCDPSCKSKPMTASELTDTNLDNSPKKMEIYKTKGTCSAETKLQDTEKELFDKNKMLNENNTTEDNECVSPLNCNNLECIKRIQKLKEAEIDMEIKIIELEKRERVYKETHKCVDKSKHRKDFLWNEIKDDSDFKPSGICTCKDKNIDLTVRIQNTEQSVKELQDRISVLENEKIKLLEETEHLLGGLTVIKSDLNKAKELTEGPSAKSLPQFHSDSSFHYSESEYSRITADNFSFGEDGECFLEPPVEPKMFTDEELRTAFDEPIWEDVFLGSREHLFQEEYPALVICSTVEQAYPKVPVIPIKEGLHKTESDSSFQYSESGYCSADDFPFGEDGECILEPPIEPKIFTDEELRSAFDEPILEDVSLGSKEHLFQEEYTAEVVCSTIEEAYPEVPVKDEMKEDKKIIPIKDDLPKIQSDSSFQYPESGYCSVDDFPFGEDGECILEPPIEPKMFTDEELRTAFDEPIWEDVSLGSKEHLFQDEYSTALEVAEPLQATYIRDDQKVDKLKYKTCKCLTAESQIEKTLKSPQKAHFAQDMQKEDECLIQEFISDSCNLELDEDILHSPLTAGTKPPFFEEQSAVPEKKISLAKSKESVEHILAIGSVIAEIIIEVTPSEKSLSETSTGNLSVKNSEEIEISIVSPEVQKPTAADAIVCPDTMRNNREVLSEFDRVNISPQGSVCPLYTKVKCHCNTILTEVRSVAIQTESFEEEMFIKNGKPTETVIAHQEKGYPEQIPGAPGETVEAFEGVKTDLISELVTRKETPEEILPESKKVEVIIESKKDIHVEIIASEELVVPVVQSVLQNAMSVTEEMEASGEKTVESVLEEIVITEEPPEETADIDLVVQSEAIVTTVVKEVVESTMEFLEGKTKIETKPLEGIKIPSEGKVYPHKCICPSLLSKKPIEGRTQEIVPPEEKERIEDSRALKEMEKIQLEKLVVNIEIVAETRENAEAAKVKEIKVVIEAEECNQDVGEFEVAVEVLPEPDVEVP